VAHEIEDHGSAIPVRWVCVLTVPLRLDIITSARAQRELKRI
jgi:hypothetical protein